MKYVIFLAVVLLALVYAEDEIPILRNDQTVNPDGSYSYSYETGNGISGQEQGQIKNAGTDEESLAVDGEFSYTNDDGTKTSLKYVADENGFQPQGDHLPQSPEVPEAILRSLEYIKTHPPPPEERKWK